MYNVALVAAMLAVLLSGCEQTSRSSTSDADLQAHSPALEDLHVHPPVTFFSF